MNFLLVALGGGLGAIIRSIISNRWNTGSFHFPKGTWIANISGSLLLALFISLHIKERLSEEFWLFAGVGFCGAYTTFSTFGKETVHLIIEGHIKKAMLYVLSSLLFSLASVIVVFLFL
ncbi:fluoride efflux transporter CrcB [Pontibacillus sp. HMF3514]|uniref:fluoride efflux transporter CrcB n=1 Tax=Pontibacillus sp. HMF3514 TaxID=2692425 RepID=UPI00132048F0|nr:fluoride efflux transporter CrcB [Pontibacillus sp. HMF3514]QHE53469.1 fluoride efflux transporter CrcB [Pontibacillus sp. HMF3514]